MHLHSFGGLAGPWGFLMALVTCQVLASAGSMESWEQVASLSVLGGQPELLYTQLDPKRVKVDTARPLKVWAWKFRIITFLSFYWGK